MRLVVPFCLVLCGCSEVVIERNEGGAGATSGPATTTNTASTSTTSGDGGREPQGGDGGAGGGRYPKDHTIVVDADIAPAVDPPDVLVLISAPDGSVSDWWTGDQLPVDAGVNDGDLVTFAYVWGLRSQASSYRVTPAVTKVTTSVFQGPLSDFCEQQAPMYVTLVVPPVDGANHYDIETSSGIGGLWSMGAGTYEREVWACEGMDSFDVVALASAYSNTDPIAFARVDDIPYVPGSSIEVPIVFSSERTNVDVVVTGAPGTDFRVSGSWYDGSFGLSGIRAHSSMTAEIDQTGTANLAYGPLAIAGGRSRISVSTPPTFFCELDTAWRIAPFDGSPFHVAFGSLAPFAPTPDGNVAIASTGEIGDVLIRWEDQYMTDPQAFWALHEDPLSPYPLPVRPEVPAGILPDFQWPNALAEIRHIHQDLAGIDDYAHFAGVVVSGADGRALHRLPQDCF